MLQRRWIEIISKLLHMFLKQVLKLFQVISCFYEKNSLMIGKKQAIMQQVFWD
jgi:hypothetical protein